MEKSFYSRTRFLPASFFVAACFLGGSFLVPSFAQAATPTGFEEASYSDEDGDGVVDTVTVVINGGENLTTCDVSAGEVASDWTYSAGEIGGTLGNATCDLATATITFEIVDAEADTTGVIDVVPTIAYVNGDADGSIANASGDLVGASVFDIEDIADPLLYIASFNDNDTLGRNDNIVFVFTEQIAEFTFDVYLGSNVLYNISDASPFISWADERELHVNLPPFIGGQYSLQNFQIYDPNGNLGASILADPLRFRVRSSGDDDTATETSTPDSSVALLAPTEGEWITSGSVVDITWSSSSEGASYATLSYSLDNGSTWMEIVRNTMNDGEYAWTTPAVEADEVMVKVVLTDLADELASDTSEAFVLSSSEASDDTSDEVPADIDGVVAGSFIKTSGSSTIYYVDASMMRRPFFDAQTFFTYQDDFSDVVEVSSETMAKFSMGAPMLPKAGVVLVKIQSVAKVYMVEARADGSYELRWVTSEEIAQDMFGSNWASYVLDIDVTLFNRYVMGSDVTSSEEVDRDMMKMRMHLHE